MFTKKKFSTAEVLMWTRRELALFLVLAAVPTVCFEVLGWTWLQLPWTPIALVGTALAFLIGFQSNAAYGRMWEARKIWGGIVNASRTWCIRVQDMVTAEHATQPITPDALRQEQHALVHRHLAWLTALRHAMRQQRSWEVHREHPTNREWDEKVCMPERHRGHDADLMDFLPQEEFDEVAKHNNRPAAILKLQSHHLRALKERGLVWEFAFLEMQNTLAQLIELQGKSERIKNFPYPRHYATLGYEFVRLFVVLLPFGVIPEFAEIGAQISKEHHGIGAGFVWLAIPFSATISWVFQTMQRIGTTGENPFEGSVNDVPISTMARSIEIDLRQLMSEDPNQIPLPVPEMSGVQM